MRRYDPDRTPDPVAWLDLDESERLDLAAKAHEGERGEGMTVRGHAAMHVAVENQVAMADESPVADTLARLMREGLHRHDAVHAIASVLAQHLLEIQQGERVGPDFEAQYLQDLEHLSARSWRSGDRGRSVSS